MKIQTTIHYQQLENELVRYNLFQGGSRSAKTYNILEWLILSSIDEQKNWNDKIISICRKTLPALRSSVFRDFIEILKKLGLFNRDDLRFNPFEYQLGNNLFEFFISDHRHYGILSALLHFITLHLRTLYPRIWMKKL